MAQIFGEAGRNATDEAFKRFRKFGLVAFLGIGALGAIEGYNLSGFAPMRGLPWKWSVLIDCLFLALIFLIARWGVKKMDGLERARMTWRKGAVGEVLVSGVLEGLPAGYFVIHDVTKRFGNIDHIVIGPTGIFVIDTKNWKGTVSADGKGELLLNDRPTGKFDIQGMQRAVMDFQSKIKALVERNHFVQGVMVFPIAYVDARFGTTKYIHCMSDEKLVDYLQNKDFSKNLSADELDRVKRATLQMAGMDERFATKSAV